MFSENAKSERLKEIKYLLSFKIITKNDIEFLIKEMNFPSYVSYDYLSEIYEYFSKNFMDGLRNHLKDILKESPELLLILDEKFLPKLQTNELLTKIREYCSNTSDKVTKLIIRCNINFLSKEDKKKKDVDNAELLLFLYVFSILQNRKDKFYEDTIKHILNLIKCKNVDEIMKLPEKLNIQNIQSEIILSKVKEDDKSDICVFIIKLLKCVLMEINEGDSFRKFEEIKELLEEYNLLSPKERKTERSLIIIIILNYFDTFIINNEEKNKELSLQIVKENSNQQNERIFNKEELFSEVYLFFGKYSMKLSTKVFLVKWFITNIQKRNVKLQYINEKVLEEIGRQIGEKYLEFGKYFSSQILPKFLIQLISSNPIKYFTKLNRFYCSIKENIKLMYFCASFPLQSKFAMFYFQVIYKQKKKERLSNIKLNSDQFDLYFDVYCVFIFLFPKVVQLIKTKEIFTKMNENLLANKEIHPFEYNDSSFLPNQNKNYSSENKKLNTYLSNKVIKYTKLQSPIKNKKTDIPSNEYLDILSSNKEAFILFIEILKNDIPYFQEKDFLKSIEVSFNNQNDGVYMLQGYFIIDKDKKKNIFLYDNNSHCWYSIIENKWINHLMFAKDLHLISVVYFKKDKTLNTRNLNFSETINEVESLTDSKERDYYWNLFQKIFNINTYLIKKDIDFYINCFSLNSEIYLKQFITWIGSIVDLNKDSKEKHLLIFVLKKVRNALKDKIQQYIERYFIEDTNTFIHSLLNYLNNQENTKKLYQTEKLALNLEYYYKRLCMNKDSERLPSILVCYLSSIYFWSTQNSKSKKNFWNQTLKKISFLSSFKKEFADKLNKRYLELIENKSSLTKIKQYLKTYSLSLSIDYKWKFLSEFFLLFSFKEDIDLHLISLITNNKYLLSLNNNKDEDIKQCLIILHEYSKIIHKNDKQKYNEWINICFETNINSIQLSDLQREMLTDYKDYIKSLLDNIDNDLENIFSKIVYIFKFVIVEKELEEWFIKCLCKILDIKNSVIMKKIEPILLSMFISSCYKNIINIQFAIIYYFKHIKIEKQREEIEQYKKYKDIQDNKDVHIITLSLGYNTENIIQIISKDNFFNQYKEFPMQQETNNEIDMFVDNEEFKDSFKNELKYIESHLKFHYALFQEIKEQEGNIIYITIHPERSNFQPYIIYNYHNSNQYFPEKMEYANNSYKLGGLIVILPLHKKRIIFLRNKSNLNWFNIREEKWEKSIDSFLKEHKNYKIVSFYVLIQKDKASNDLSLKTLQSEKIEQIEFTEDIKKIVKWFINNASYSYQKYFQFFKKNFGQNKLFIMENDTTLSNNAYKNIEYFDSVIGYP